LGGSQSTDARDRRGSTPNLNGASCGGYPGWEEFNGIIRRIQICSRLLSLSDVQSVISAPQSSAAGQTSSDLSISICAPAA